jgi:hypothetical protein
MSIIFKSSEVRMYFIKSVFLIFCTVYLSFNQEVKAQVISNTGSYVSISTGTVIGTNTIKVDNTTTIANEGILNISTLNNEGITQGNGTYNIEGDFINTGTFNSNTSTVNFNGLGTSTIGGTNDIEFYNLKINKISATTPQIILGVSVTAKNNLTMTQGKTNLAGHSLTLGSDALLPGTLTYTSGWLYGGKFTRWFDVITSNIIPSSVGHFPMGTSTTDYRPFWEGSSVPLSSGGTISVVHNPVSPSSASPAHHTDNSWGSGTTLQGISTSSWIVSTDNGLSSSSSNISIRFGGTGFSPFNPADVNASLVSSVVGTYSPTTNANTLLEVNRNNLSTSELSNTFYIGSSSMGSSPLAIKLIYFDVECGKREVKINWATASEDNNDYFTIERTQDGIHFEEIGKIVGAGNSSHKINYSFIDSNPLQGVSYYRLKQIDFNGRSEYFNVVATSCGENDFQNMTIYPNPAKTDVTIALNMEITAGSYIAFSDMRGTIIKKIQCEATTNQLKHINISDFSSGCYIVRLINGDGVNYSVRLIKQ